MSAPDLATLEAGRERAYLAYNAAAQALPECEHVRAWRREVQEARDAHLAALRAYEKAADKARAPVQCPAEPEPAQEPPVAAERQGALFELGEAA